MFILADSAAGNSRKKIIITANMCYNTARDFAAVVLKCETLGRRRAFYAPKSLGCTPKLQMSVWRPTEDSTRIVVGWILVLGALTRHEAV